MLHMRINLRQSYTHDSSPLNTDYLPITAVLQYQHSTVSSGAVDSKENKNWSKVRNSTYLRRYQNEAIVAPLIGHSYNSSDEIDKEISQRRFVLLPVSLSSTAQEFGQE